MAETNAQRKKRRIIPNTLAEQEVTPQLGTNFARSVGGGLRQVEAIGQNLAAQAGAAVGADEFAEERLAAGREAQAAAQRSAPRVQRVEDITNFEDAVDFVVGVAGQQGPILATTIGGGVVGALARKVAPAAVAARVSAPAAAAIGAVGTGIGLESGSIFGDIANDPESRENFTLQQLAGVSAVGGVTAGSLEALPVISAFRRFGLGKSATRAIRSSLAKRVGKGAGAQALLEGGTEGAQTIIERATAKFANENREILGEEGISEVLNAVVAGAVIGTPLGAVSGAFQRGSVEDQLDVEESLDELETAGGFSSEIDSDLDELGGLGVDIRASRDLVSETELAEEPERVIDRLVKRTLETGSLPTRRSFAQLVEAVSNLDNPAQLDNILIEAGVGDNLRPGMRDALLGEVQGLEEDHISLAVDERPTSTFEETGGGGFQSPNVTRTHILRNRNDKLGFVPANSPEQENALRSTLANLESDFPDITFGVDGLGDAVFESLPAATKKDPAKTQQALLSVANEKLNEVGFNATKFAELDPANPRAFLNQFKAISKQEVDVSLTGKDEFRLTDSDLVGGTRPGQVQVGGPVTPLAATTRLEKLLEEARSLQKQLTVSKLTKRIPGTVEEQTQRRKRLEAIKTQIKEIRGVSKSAGATITQGKARPIFVKRDVSKDGDFTADARGKPQTVDAIALTNRMLTKLRLNKAPSTQEVANAFFNGLSALVQRGVVIPDLLDSLIIHKGKGVSGRKTTFGEVKAKGSGRIRARILALKTEQVKIEEEIKDIAKNMRRASVAAQRSMKNLQKRLRRRVKKVPTEIETLNMFGESVSDDVQDLIARLNDADELANAAKSEQEGFGDLAIEIQELRRQLDREGFSTRAAEDLSNMSDRIDALDKFADDTKKAARQRTEEADGAVRFPGDPEDIEFNANFALGLNTLAEIRARKTFISINDKAQRFLETSFETMTKKLNITNARIITGEEALETLRIIDGGLDSAIEMFARGEVGGWTFTINRDKPFIRRSTKKLFGDNDHIIVVNPYIDNERLLHEILAHEVGHVVFKNAFENASLDVQNAVRSEFNQWRADLALRDPTAGEALASKEAFASALESMAGDLALKNVSQLTDANFSYLADFEEWFADQVSRWFTPTPTQLEKMTGVDRFFKAIADGIKDLWTFIIETTDFRPARSVDAFLNDVVKSNPELMMKEAHTRFAKDIERNPQKFGELDSDNMGVTAAFQSLDPFGPSTNWQIRAVMRDNMKPEERKVLFQFFNRRSTKKRLKELLTDPKQRDLIDNSPLHAAAFGYQMWIAGTFKLQKPSQEVQETAESVAFSQRQESEREADPRVVSTQGPPAVVQPPKLASTILEIFTGLFDALSARLGFVYESEQAEQILEAIRDGTFDARKVGTETFSVVKAVRGDVLQRTAQVSNDAFQHIVPFFDKMLGVADSRMLDSGVPALIKIAQIFHARTGSEGQPETFFEARRTKIGEFMNRYTRITAALQEDSLLKADVLEALRNPRKARNVTVIQHATAIRKLLRRIRNYVEESGVAIGDRGKDYFPWVFDPRKVQDNSDFVRDLLNDPRFAKNMEGILESINEGIRNENIDLQVRGGASKFQNPRDEITKEELIERMMMGLEQSEGLADTNLNPNYSGTVPFFGAMNKRTLGFLTEKNKLTAEERERFDSLFSDQLDLTMMTYIRQAVKRTEYTRRAGVGSRDLLQNLQEARDEGASAADMRMANQYIDAMTGVIGESTNNRISKLLGLGPREGEVINPHWRTFTSIAMVLQNFAVLPLATLTSLVDPVGILVRSQDMGAAMAALRTGAKEIVAEIRIIAGGDEKKLRSEIRKLGEAMGTIEDHMTNEALEWEYGSTYLTPRLKATNEWFFKAIGLTQWTRVSRLMGLAGGKEFIKRHVQRPNNNSDRFLRQMNITAEDVKFDENGDLRILTRLERDDPTTTKEELARDDRVRNALNRFVDEAILRPNAAQRPIWASDPNFALVFHLKSFMFSFHDRILRRATQELEFGNTTPFMLLAVFIPAMLFADIWRDLIQYGIGGNPRKARWGLIDHIWNAMQRSGLNGIGQLLVDAKEDVQFGGIGYESLSGPTIDGITDLGGLFSEDDQAQWNAFTRNLPASTVWKHWLENGLDES